MYAEKKSDSFCMIFNTERMWKQDNVECGTTSSKRPTNETIVDCVSGCNEKKPHSNRFLNEF